MPQSFSGPRIVGFAGSFSQPSKTRTLVSDAAERTARRFGGTAHVFDVLDLGADFGAVRAGISASAKPHYDAFLNADALIVGSPVYKGSYTGLFKHFIDLIDPTALAGKPVLLCATGGGDRHALVIEHQLRPLFGFFEARSLATGLYASNADFTDGRLTAAAASERLDRAVAQFKHYLLPIRRPVRAIG